MNIKDLKNVEVLAKLVSEFLKDGGYSKFWKSAYSNEFEYLGFGFSDEVDIEDDRGGISIYTRGHGIIDGIFSTSWCSSETLDSGYFSNFIKDHEYYKIEDIRERLSDHLPRVLKQVQGAISQLEAFDE